VVEGSHVISLNVPFSPSFLHPVEQADIPVLRIYLVLISAGFQAVLKFHIL
jgi:hypothetical protein